MRLVTNVATGIVTIVELSDEEKAQHDAWTDGAPGREMEQIRNHRNSLLAETDWMATSDLTMSDAWKTYRQDLRDIPASNTTYADVTWPTKPE